MDSASEKRAHPRFVPNNLTTRIIIEPPKPAAPISIDGTVVDMSYTGIKIKLNTPITTDISNSEVIIHLTMPESGVPVSIHGVIKYLSSDQEYGLQYLENYSEDKVDDLMFECIKIS